MKFRTFARFAAGATADLGKHLRVNLGRRGASLSLRDRKGRSIYNTRTRKAKVRVLGFEIARKLGGRRG